MSFDWMRWTLPSAYFFVSIVIMLIFLALYDEISPGYPRKGLLPIETTRGDRVFISLLALGSTVFIWLGALPTVSIWWAMAIGAVEGTVILRWF
jgi:predicted small integral membrane protein